MPSVLVTGATGKQGGATVNALVALNRPDIKILALTRNPHSASAKSLLSRGVGLVEGDLSGHDSILSALKNADAAHLVTDFNGPGGVKGEIEGGKYLLIVLEKSAGLKHLVFSSVAGAAAARNVPHFQSKHVIESYIIDFSIPSTFIRPTNFMENTPPPGIGRFFFLGVMKAVFGSERAYHISCEDIGKIATKALLDDSFKGKSLDLVGQIATADKMKECLDEAEGYKSWRVWVPRWLVFRILPAEFREMFTFLSKTYTNNEMPGTVESLSELVGSVVGIETWARRQKATREGHTAKKDL